MVIVYTLPFLQIKKTDDCIGEEVEKAVAAMKDGEVLLLENVRFYPEEEKNVAEFSKKLAANADLYVNDAFGTAHRAHSSTAGVTEFLKPSVAGFLLQKVSRAQDWPISVSIWTMFTRIYLRSQKRRNHCSCSATIHNNIV